MGCSRGVEDWRFTTPSQRRSEAAESVGPNRQTARCPHAAQDSCLGSKHHPLMMDIPGERSAGVAGMNARNAGC